MKNFLITAKAFGGDQWPELEKLCLQGKVQPLMNPHDRAMSAEDICQINEKTPLAAIMNYSSSDEISRRVFECCKQLEVVSRHGVGMDAIDLEAAEEFGVEIRRTDNNTDNESVADFTYALMLGLIRRVYETSQSLKSHRWERPNSMDFWGKTLGIVGLGRIGKAVAARAVGFSLKILAHDPYVDPGYASERGVRLCGLEELLKTSDIVTLHCPLDAKTAGMIGPKQLQMMKRTGFLINAARSGLVDQAALLDALKNRTIAGAAVDVYDVEPALKDPLIEAGLDNLLPTPHVAAYTVECIRTMDRLAVTNALDVLVKKG